MPYVPNAGCPSVLFYLSHHQHLRNVPFSHRSLRGKVQHKRSSRFILCIPMLFPCHSAIFIRCHCCCFCATFTKSINIRAVFPLCFHAYPSFYRFAFLRWFRRWLNAISSMLFFSLWTTSLASISVYGATTNHGR